LINTETMDYSQFDRKSYYPGYAKAKELAAKASRGVRIHRTYCGVVTAESCEDGSDGFSAI
jgi:hypothetical protein